MSVFERPLSALRAEASQLIAAPSMWTRPQIKDFKEKIRQDVDSVITVGRGEVVTVRVPTHEEGSYLFWEFASDHYDVGFGVYFEWTDSGDTGVSVHVSESSEDEEEDGGESPPLDWSGFSSCSKAVKARTLWRVVSRCHFGEL